MMSRRYRSCYRANVALRHPEGSTLSHTPPPRPVAKSGLHTLAGHGCFKVPLRAYGGTEAVEPPGGPRREADPSSRRAYVGTERDTTGTASYALHDARVSCTLGVGVRWLPVFIQVFLTCPQLAFFLPA